jgi:opacity protein-like surface antigen
MRTPVVLFAALALFCATPALAARGNGRIGVQFGESEPTGGLSGSTTNGIQGGLFGTYFEAEHVGVGLDVAYHSWDGPADATTQAMLDWIAGSSVTIRDRALQTTAHLVYDIQGVGAARPYLKGGVGLYWFKTDLHVQGRSLRGGYNPKFGSFVGAGIDFRVDEAVALGVGGNYHVIPSDNGNLQFITFAVDVCWMGGK